MEHVRRTELNELGLEAEAAYSLLGDTKMKGAAARMKAEYCSKEGTVGFQRKGPTPKPSRSNEEAIRVDRTGLHPLHVGRLPNRLAGLNSRHINVQRSVAGAVSRSRRDIHYAASLNPLASSVLSLEPIHDLTEEMLEAHRQYLPVGMWMPGDVQPGPTLLIFRAVNAFGGLATPPAACR